MNLDGSIKNRKPDIYIETETDGYQYVFGKNDDDEETTVGIAVYQYGSHDPLIEFCTEDTAIRVELASLVEFVRGADEYLKNNY